MVGFWGESEFLAVANVAGVFYPPTTGGGFLAQDEAYRQWPLFVLERSQARVRRHQYDALDALPPFSTYRFARSIVRRFRLTLPNDFSQWSDNPFGSTKILSERSHNIVRHLKRLVVTFGELFRVHENTLGRLGEQSWVG